ncbi:DUF6088 family protein [Pseudomonas otitidis]|uniref:DUF6088 family protein n=1 Tax=Metapseudomonas otitidis TaxID=319939 RepID=UPI00244889CE|nr:DUF6088 family protein [Pseudomonas otitidis]MDH1107355.1 DUF6088 family protein [Pseudomonas otitidis]MDH1157828.1 DUF6088 family protein [Pseudomonas otitidis]MDH1164333.1 DUF6088 family protein [Pseudomonas otitidis]
MLMPMKTLTEQILDSTRQLPEGEVVMPGSFLHIGSRSAVQRGLSDLVAEGKLLRIERGFYVATIESRFGVRSPAPERVVRSWGSARGEVIVHSGARSANKLGLTTQVPVRLVYLSSGRSRELRIGRLIVSIHHAPRWSMALGDTGVGEAIRAIEWLGPLWAAKALQKLHNLLPAAEWSALVGAQNCVPDWIGSAIRTHLEQAACAVNKPQFNGHPF